MKNEEERKKVKSVHSRHDCRCLGIGCCRFFEFIKSPLRGLSVSEEEEEEGGEKRKRSRRKFLIPTVTFLSLFLLFHHDHHLHQEHPHPQQK